MLIYLFADILIEQVWLYNVPYWKMLHVGTYMGIQIAYT